MNKIIVQEDGLVMAFTAIVLPVILLIGALMIDGGQLFIRHGEIEHLSRQSGQSGLLEAAEILEVRADQNYQSQCNVEFPPSRCSSDNIFDFLSVADLDSLILNGSNQNQVTQNATDFSVDYDPRSQLEDTNITITYPYLYSTGDPQVKMLVEIETVPNLLLGSIFNSTEPIAYNSVSYLSLQ